MLLSERSRTARANKKREKKTITHNGLDQTNRERTA
jgi:hypothetical protein